MTQTTDNSIRTGKPKWLRRRLPAGPDYEAVRSLIRDGQLHTVCQEAKCPNQFECFSRHTATFLILGSRCTRDCRFCSVQGGPPGPPDPREPKRVAEAAHRLKLRYVVVTSVTRDDLEDGGAGLFADTIREIHRQNPGARVEVLIPDFQGNQQALNTVLNAEPDVLNHNIETVPRLYPAVRPQARYGRSLALIRRVSSRRPDIPTKSGLMLGLGEKSREICQSLSDLLKAGCRILTLGQYLQPSRRHLPVDRFVTPGEFDNWRRVAVQMGFSQVASGPFVRSSYHARELFRSLATDCEKSKRSIKER